MANEEFLNEQEKIEYFQKKLHESLLACINAYSLINIKMPLLHATSASIFMDFRNSVLKSIHDPSRYKGSQSMLDNFAKELKNNYFNLDSSTELKTKNDIDNYFKTVIEKVAKDFFGYTFVAHTQNDVQFYCERAFDEEPRNDEEKKDYDNLKQLYKQYISINNYLEKSKKIKDMSYFKKIYYSHIPIDISDTFIDGKPIKSQLKQLPPLDISNVNTPKEYYTQLVSLLTLLTNCSMPCNDGTSKYAVGQTDISYLKLVEEAKTYHPRNKDEWIEILTKLAHEHYHLDSENGYQSFDIQLKNALDEMEKLRKTNDYTKPFKTERDKVYYNNRLSHLRENLDEIKNDRLINYILKREMPSILNGLSDHQNLEVEIVQQKERSKQNGFYALYYILLINNIVEVELQAKSEFRHNLSQEGNSAHNSMPGKGFDIRHLFELNTNFSHPFNKNRFNLYCDFLETVNLNDIFEYGNKISKNDEKNMENLRLLQDLVEYATSNIKVKDTIEVNGQPMSFFNYIDSLVDARGARFFNTMPAHRIEHNQAMVVPQNKLYSLEMLLKNRIGLSLLANQIREKYKEEYTKRNMEILPDDKVTAYSPEFTAKYDLPRINKQLQKNIAHYEENDAINIPFHPQGQYPNDDER